MIQPILETGNLPPRASTGSRHGRGPGTLAEQNAELALGLAEYANTRGICVKRLELVYIAEMTTVFQSLIGQT